MKRKNRGEISESMAREAHKPPTLKTIAELSGLAVPTVSRALSDAPDIGKNTKEKVRRIAKEIGYVPNRAGVRLKTGKTNVIALVLSTDHGIINRTARLIASAAGALRGTRYHLNVTPYFPAEDVMVPIRYIVETRSADAIIMNQTEPDDPRIAYLMDIGFPFATHGRTNWADRHSYFDFDNYAFTQQAIGLLADKGHKNVVVVAPPEDQNYSQDILNAMSSTAADLGITATNLEGATSDDPDDDIFAALVQALQDNPDIGGILASSTPAAMTAAAAIEAVGKTVGDDVDLIGKETTPLLHLFRPKIITYFEDITRAGEFLAEAAIHAVERPEAGPRQYLEVPEICGFRTGLEILSFKTKGLTHGGNDEGRGAVSGPVRGG